MKNLFILVGALVEIETEMFKAVTKKLTNPTYITVALELRKEIMEAMITSGVKARVCELETAAKEVEKAAEKFTKALTKGIKAESPTVSVTVEQFE